MYALLHDADPGPDGLYGVMCERHAPVYLDAGFDDDGNIEVTTRCHFIASRRGRPSFVTIWDGPYWYATMPIDVTDTAYKGVTVKTDLSWTMKVEP